MSAAAPAIYVRIGSAPRLGWAGRVFALALAGVCLAVLVTAAGISPDPRGVGTHTQLGLAPCQFEARLGIPCPTCGMTTSFAHFVRGQLLASLYVQPFGPVLALAAAMAVWGGIYVGWTGRPVYRMLRLTRGVGWLIPLFAAVILAWGWKIFTHVRGS